MAMATLTNMSFRAGRYSGCSLFILFYVSVVPSLIVTLHAEISNSFQQVLCGNDTYYDIGSVFESNLNRVLSDLVEHTSQTSGFNTSVYGQSPDRVYGLLQCRGDTTADQCHNCAQNASTTLRQKCGNATEGYVWFELCFLRYESYDFFGELDVLNEIYLRFDDNFSNPHDFNLAVKKLFNNLSAEAVSGSKLYASGATKDSLSRTIYGLVQCTRDISRVDCTTCLSNTIDEIVTYYRGSKGVEGLVGSCRVRYDVSSFFNSTYLQQPAAEAPAKTTVVIQSGDHTNKSSNYKIVIISVAVVGGLLLALLLLLFTTRKRLKGYQAHEQIDEETPVSEDRQIVTFKMETLVAATENFHDDNKLGEGGFGPVYKGITRDEKEIAVKKLSLNSTQGNKEFLTEVKLVAQIQHRNLVKLLGCCVEGSQRMLVYEYLSNSSLDKILFDPIKRKYLDWQKRYSIILGVARGLLYLHEDSQPRIIHRDIKASNILLDENLNPKIADFGLAKLFPEDESYVSSLTKVSGTLGYMAPEYAMHGQLSAKADVYSFGVLLLELVTGRKNTDYNLSPEMQILLGWVWKSYEGQKSVEIIDPVATIKSSDKEQALRCIEVGLWCTQADSSLRPAMSTVTLMLSSHYVTLPELTKPVVANSVSRINSSGSGLSHASASISSAAPPSNASVSSIEMAPR